MKRFFAIFHVLLMAFLFGCAPQLVETNTTVPTMCVTDEVEAATTIPTASTSDEVTTVTTTPSVSFSEEYGVPTFSVTDYQDYMDKGYIESLHLNAGPINSRRAAETAAKQLFKQYLHCEKEDFVDRSIQAFFDPASDCWLVVLLLPPHSNQEIPWEGPWPVLDCEPCVILDSNGDVWALWTR